MDLTENLNLIGYSMTENRQLKNIDEGLCSIGRTKSKSERVETDKSN